MTYATDRGFKVGDKVVVTYPESKYYREVLTLEEDDGLAVLWFARENGDLTALHLDKVKLCKERASVEGLIQKRDEAKEAFTKAKQELNEKLESLGLQERDNEVVLKSTEDFEWVEAYWTEFSVGDPIKVVEAGESSFTGVIIKVDEGCRNGLHLKIEYDLKDDYNWFGGSNYKFYKKVNK